MTQKELDILMTFATNLLSSNAIQLALTFAFGASLCLLPVRKVVLIAGTFFAVGVILSFFFLVGEVYVYSENYRRAFLIFGDNITTILGFTFLYAIAAKRNVIALLAISGVFMSGGKASIILLLLMLSIFIIVQRRGSERRAEAVRIASLFVLGISVYVILQALSLSLMHTSGFAAARNTIVQGIVAVRQIRFSASGEASQDASDYDIPGFGTACSSASLCLQTQFASPLSQRYYTSLAGLWMTSQGGFTGSRFPSSPESFADLMMAANPWGMNDKYGLTWRDWRMMGGIQNPYMNFGAGYGPWALLALFAILFAIGYLAAENLGAGETDTSAAFSIFFIVTVVANWTQSWLMSGSFILVLLGLCACRILVAWVLRRNILSDRRHYLERLALRFLQFATRHG
jgi:hypothetical protein